MMKHPILALYAILPLYAAAVATISKRAVDGVYLVNCGFKNANTWYSEYDYYINAEQNSQAGQPPDDSARTLTPVGSIVVWEGGDYVSN